MVCPGEQSNRTRALIAGPHGAEIPAGHPPEDAGVADRFERFAGTVFVGLFAAGLFDQAMLPAVSAALEDTGRLRNTPWLRAIRTAASDQIAFFGDPVDRRAETDRLLRLHRDVKGAADDGTRYSALNPEAWNWILISTFFMHRNAFEAVSGERLTAADNQTIWERFLSLTAGLHLPGRSKPIGAYDELSRYYDRVVAGNLECTATLECAVTEILRPVRSHFLPKAAAPLWQLVGPAAGHVVAVLGFGSMRPSVRTIIPMTWTRRHDLEYAALIRLLGFAHRWLPNRLTDTPLARNRRQYERLMAQYRGIGLSSFAPNPSTTPAELAGQYKI